MPRSRRFHHEITKIPPRRHEGHEDARRRKFIWVDHEEIEVVAISSSHRLAFLSNPSAHVRVRRLQLFERFGGLDMLADPSGTNAITNTIIGCGIKVHRHFGPGLFESAYLHCLVFELEEAKLTVEQGKAVPLVYRGVRLNAAYRLDLLVNGLVIVELKAVDKLAPIHRSQMITYLKLTNCPVGLIMNFNATVLKDGVVRVINSDYRETDPALTVDGVRQPT